ncbi:hypothetical protein [Streptomyces sp. NBC_00893]|uniref:hypothetical protein n=1 Tax=Streptomyces sp. NBC_00893 TaxID=2975862 RepID=UPI002259084D|nr:hypothetical protein [Streptomyces sp. NBC_00893]MCX4850630.1 hypothetical protein [Streptomyces sp. NBC_00893]
MIQFDICVVEVLFRRGFLELLECPRIGLGERADRGASGSPEQRLPVLVGDIEQAVGSVRRDAGFLQALPEEGIVVTLLRGAAGPLR